MGSEEDLAEIDEGYNVLAAEIEQLKTALAEFLARHVT